MGIDLRAHSLASLLASSPPGGTRVALHVGSWAKGDLLEARLLQEAVRLAHPAAESHPERGAVGGAAGPADAACGPGGGRSSGRSGRGLVVQIHVHERRGHNLALAMRSEGYLEPLLRSHLDEVTGHARGDTGPSVAAAGRGSGVSVPSLVESANAGEPPPVVPGARPVETAEERWERVRRVNAGLSVWAARAEEVVSA